MRILVTSPYLPWPVITGGNAAQFATLKCLADDHQYTLVCPVYDRRAELCARELQTHLPTVKVRAVYCGHPAPPAAPPNWMVRLGRSLVRQGRRWLLPPPPAPAPDSCSDLPFYPFYPLPDKFIEALHEELSNDFDLYQMEFAEMLPLGAWFPKDIPRLFVQHQIHFVYASRFLEAIGSNSRAEYLAAVMKAQEVVYLQNYHGVITFSDFDRQALLPYLSPDRLYTSPFPLPADTVVTGDIPCNFDGRFIFLGSGEHFPNRNALQWLLTAIWPEILRQLPSAQLVVIGQWNDLEKAGCQVAGVKGVKFLGFVPDLSAALRGGIMLVPLRIGSGIRVKIMAALAQGVPVVSTSVGCEGLCVNDGEEILIRNREAEFAGAAVLLATNPDLRQKLSAAGAAAVRHYSPATVRRRRNEIYAGIVQRSQAVEPRGKRSPAEAPETGGIFKTG